MSFYDDTDKIAGGENFRYVKPDQKSGVVIQFYHVPTVNKAIEQGLYTSQATFKAFLTSFKDNFKVNWNPKETFGRMDAIQTYKNTQRQISLEFDVPSVSLEEGQLNFLNLQSLVQMQYPVYEVVETSKVVTPATPATNAAPPSNIPPAGTPNTTTTPASGTDRDLEAAAAKKTQEAATAPIANKDTSRFISSPPLIYVKFMNWVSGDFNQANTGKAGIQNALVATVSEVSFSPDLEQGFYAMDNFNEILVPKLFTVSLNLTIIHTQELGWVNKVNGTNETLTNHLFGEPKADEGDQEGFVPYPTFPYQTHDIKYRSPKK